MRILIIAASVIALAACNADPVQNESLAANENTADTMGSEKLAVPAPDADEPADSNEAAPVEASIPTALHGRWGLVPADCTSTRGDAKGLLEISDTELRFYESVGTVGEIAERDDSRIVADFAFIGEGQTWQRRMVLDAQDGGETLIRRDYGDDAMPGALRYQKCDAV